MGAGRAHACADWTWQPGIKHVHCACATARIRVAGHKLPL